MCTHVHPAVAVLFRERVSTLELAKTISRILGKADMESAQMDDISIHVLLRASTGIREWMSQVEKPLASILPESYLHDNSNLFTVP